VALTKAEVNERYYQAVAGQIVFGTEGQGVLHPLAVAKLLAAQARALGRRELKLLELGANDASFATSLLKILSALTMHGEAALDRVEYFAVDLARRSLEAHFEEAEGSGDFQRATPGGPASPLVGTLVRLGVPQITLHLVHSEAQAFVSGGAGA